MHANASRVWGIREPLRNGNRSGHVFAQYSMAFGDTDTICCRPGWLGESVKMCALITATRVILMIVLCARCWRARAANENMVVQAGDRHTRAASNQMVAQAVDRHLMPASLTRYITASNKWAPCALGAFVLAADEYGTILVYWMYGKERIDRSGHFAAATTGSTVTRRRTRATHGRRCRRDQPSTRCSSRSCTFSACVPTHSENPNIPVAHYSSSH
ncbi:unnamed protein product [Sphagnum balticum]